MKHLHSVLAVLLVLALIIGCMPAMLAAPAAETVEAQLDAVRAEAVRAAPEQASAFKAATNRYLMPNVTTNGQAVVRGSSTTIRLSSYSESRDYTQWLFIYPGTFAESADADYIDYSSYTDRYGYGAYTYKWTANAAKYALGDYCVVTCVTDAEGNLDKESVCYADMKVVGSATALSSISLVYAEDDAAVGTEEVVMTVGDTEAVYVRFHPYYTTADRLVGYSSSDPAIAAVESFLGICAIEAVAPGTVTITGTCAGKTATMKLRVLPNAQSITVTTPADTLCCDSELQLSAEVQPAEYAQHVVWASSDEAIAMVDPTGLVMGMAPGTVTITATCGSRSDSVELTVGEHIFAGETTVVPNSATQPGLESGNCSVCGGENVTNVLPAIFTDTAAGQWYAEHVDYVYDNGLMNGVGEHTFNPSGSLNRAMVVTILYRIAGTPEVAEAPAFTDVAEGEWYTDAVAWAAANGIVTGYPDGTFLPKKAVTREQIATMLYRFARFNGEDVTGLADLSDFSDGTAVSSYAVTAMRWAVDAGLINGVSTEGIVTLSPKGTATRAQFAAIIARYVQSERQQGITVSLFDGKVTLQLPADWAEHYVLVEEADNAAFFSKLNYASGEYPGRLFSLCLSDLPDEAALDAVSYPSYEYLGQWSGGILFALYPTDVQYNYEDAALAAEYIALYDALEGVISTVTVTE